MTTLELKILLWKEENIMVNGYELDTTDEKIINELDNLCGVAQNKEILRDIILYIKLKQNNELNFGNYNIIVRNNSTYNLLNDLLKVCSKVFIKYNIIQNNKICYLDKTIKKRDDDPFDKIKEIKDSIIVINENKLRIDYSDEFDNLKKVTEQYKDRIFVFEDTNFREGEADGELGELATFRMTIDKISLEDKIMYCKKIFNKYDLKFKQQDLLDFVDVPFWNLKNMMIKLLIDCKSKNLNLINKQMLQQNKEFYINGTTDKKKEQIIENNKNKKAKDLLNDLIGLEETKNQIIKILNYVKINKERGQMPSLHMCFTGNPGTGKTSIARVIGKIFEEEHILNSNGNFIEIHGRDLVDKYVGWTAQKVHRIVEKAIGGVLFIDEAYSLVSDRRGSFEDEAIATLIKEMEDHRNEICIILAGYTQEMKNLIKLNPGFESRIQFIINFPDYDEGELMEIFEKLCKDEKFKLSNSYIEILKNNFIEARKKENFGNGRYVRNLFEKVKFEQANRIVQTNSKYINYINKCDIENAIKSIHYEEKETRKIGFCI